MKTRKYIPLDELCRQYEVEMSFFTSLDGYELVTIELHEGTPCIHTDHLREFEKIIRLHHQLDINLEGIDSIMHLLQRIRTLQSEVLQLQNRLRLYEN